MKLVTYERDGQIRIGAVTDRGVVSLASVASDMLSLISMGGGGLSQARSVVERAESATPLAEVRLLAPIPKPRRNVMCLGVNYREHVKESQTMIDKLADGPEFPIIFTKATTTVNGPYDEIPYDAAVSAQIDWEVELAVIIGRTGKNILVEEAMAYVYGYTVLNDISARDLQRQHKQFFKGKSLDGSCPMGPWIVTSDEVPDPHNLRLASRVNGVVKQDSHTGQMIVDIPHTLAELSNGMSLLPGDIIATGTPGGVGFARNPPEFLRPGDVVECEVEGIGQIKNRIVDN
jgi:2-keto-4-pentenoate hydratase/2-oxohepta-3-ene-1,7-dioic acid hydratase in catechol pathway